MFMLSLWGLLYFFVRRVHVSLRLSVYDSAALHFFLPLFVAWLLLLDLVQFVAELLYFLYLCVSCLL